MNALCADLKKYLAEANVTLEETVIDYIAEIFADGNKDDILEGLDKLK
jgi:hypothetical protein